MMQENYFIRHASLIDPELLELPIYIIGAGAIGSWTGLALAKMGASQLTVFDADVISAENIGPQIYNGSDIGKKKVVALSEKIKDAVSLEIQGMSINWSEQYAANSGIVISCVDNMATRQALLEAHAGKKVKFIDGRMAANEIHIYTVDMSDPEQVADYVKTLFSDEAASPVPCSARAVIYNALTISGLISNIVAALANGREVPFFIEADLYNFDLFK